MRASPLLRIACGLAVASCGRIAFDERGDAGTPDTAAEVCAAPVGHDEDADGIDDSCDGCPHIPDPDQPDRDADGVDDACDPRPDTAGETIALFASFAAAHPMIVQAAAAVTYDADDLVANAITGRVSMQLARAPTRGTYVVGGTIVAVSPTENRQLIVGVDSDLDAATYYCELQGPADSAKLGVTYTLDGVDYEIAARSDGDPLTPGPYRLGITDALPDIVCETTWNVPDQTIEATLPSGFAPMFVEFAIANVDARVHYFLAIDSPP